MTGPSFQAFKCNNDEPFPPLEPEAAFAWLAVCSCAISAPLRCFQDALIQLIMHPEYNSTLILRSEVVSDTESQGIDDGPVDSPRLKGFHFSRTIRRKLLPRRPGRDNGIDQYCTFYTHDTLDHAQESSCMVLTPIVPDGQDMPYYHPAVAHLAFRYIRTHESFDEVPSAQLRIEIVPLDTTITSLDPNCRLYRTCLALLEALHRYCWGALKNYKKRVMHDCLISREAYQDLYLEMRERHKYLVDQWAEVTDPLKHVFEDIAIASYLMLLWKDTFETPSSNETIVSSPPERNWPGPPGGFLDLGCGNGLLTHILISEGYHGYGVDVRARISWTKYPANTQSQLHVHPLNPVDNIADQPSYFTPGVFLIANHADELTPWTPVLSTLAHASGYLSIPCCAWSFDSKFDRTALSTGNQVNFLNTLSIAENGKPDPTFVQSLNLGGDGSNTSAYSLYRIWLAALSMYCGWTVECDVLRIPSTRNWAIIGRRTSKDSSDDSMTQTGIQNAKNIIRIIRGRAVFKARRPEGKSGDH